jgi:hypothetical protein
VCAYEEVFCAGSRGPDLVEHSDFAVEETRVPELEDAIFFWGLGVEFQAI